MKNERLELTDKDSLYFLGPNLTLRNCTVVLKVSARSLLITRPRFIDCTFEVKQELKNHQSWISASLKGCRFKGRLSGCDFGHWPEYGSEPEYKWAPSRTATSPRPAWTTAASMGATPAPSAFPKWPCFTILDPVRRAAELSNLKWPEPVWQVVDVPLDESPEKRIKHPPPRWP